MNSKRAEEHLDYYAEFNREDDGYATLTHGEAIEAVEFAEEDMAKECRERAIKAHCENCAQAGCPAPPSYVCEALEGYIKQYDYPNT